MLNEQASRRQLTDGVAYDAALAALDADDADL